MSKIIKSIDQVTRPPHFSDNWYYVIARDTLMSGWGKAENKENWMFFLCYDRVEVENVMQSCKNRSDVDVHFTLERKCVQPFEIELSGMVKMINNPKNLISMMDRDSCQRWYTEGAFT
jgi:hypothetical protein